MVAWGWEQHAACRGADTSVFFAPDRFESKRERSAREAAAKEICARCPAVEPCRQYALGNEEVFGVWGGLGAVERRRLREAVRRKAG